MSRSGYVEDMEDNWAMICYRGAVQSAVRGQRGQRLLRDLVAALDAMPEKKLITDELVESGQVCALGAVGVRRGVDMEGLDPEDSETVAACFDVAPALAREVVYMNDEWSSRETPEQRFSRMRAWAAAQIIPK